MFAEQQNPGPEPFPSDLPERPATEDQQPLDQIEPGVEIPVDLQAYLQDLEERPVRTALREIAQRAKEGLNQARETAIPYLDYARDETLRTANEIRNGAVVAGKTAVEATTRFVKNSAEATKQTAQKIPGEVAKIYERLGADPEKEAGLLNELVKIAPVIGAAQEYADGWRAYHKGKELDRPELIEKGRILCIAAMINGKFDVLTLGVGSLLRHTPRLALLGLRALTAMRGLNAISKYNLDPISHLATYLVKNHEQVRNVADATLESIRPRSLSLN